MAQTKAARKIELLRRLAECAVLSATDPEVAHVNADDLLLGYINDLDVTQAFEKVKRWYA